MSFYAGAERVLCVTCISSYRTVIHGDAEVDVNVTGVSDGHAATGMGAVTSGH